MDRRKMRVWHIPQIPGTPFTVEVSSVKEGVLLMNALAQYDIFQFENNIKPDYCNANGLEVFEDGEWTDWYYENGDYYFDDPRKYVEAML